MATLRATPARSRFRTVVRRQSWSSRPGPTGAISSHTYSQARSYLVGVTVTAKGVTTFTSKTITVPEGRARDPAREKAGGDDEHTDPLFDDQLRDDFAASTGPPEQ